MPHPFELTFEQELPATPEQVWDAIATGPGIDSWFMGRNDVEPREGGTARMTTGGQAEDAVVTAYEPGHRFASRSTPGPDGRFMAFEYLVEGRGQGSTVLRVVHSGMLGDDWQDEYDALRRGWPFHLDTLREYLTHFAGRTGVPVFAAAPAPSLSADGLRSTLGRAVATLDGDVVADEPDRLRVRSADALLAFFVAPGLAFLFGHLFTEASPDDADADWQRWLSAAVNP